MVRNFGVHPLFIFDPDDRSNAPVPGDSTAAWWPIYPQQFRRVFTQAFTRGLHDASLNGRVLEGTWRRALLSLHDSVSACAGCACAGLLRPGADRAALLALPRDAARPADAHGPRRHPGPVRGRRPERHHLYRDHRYRTACASVEPHPGRPGRVIMRNLTDKTWTVVADGEEPKRVAPSQRLGVRPMQIDFGTVRGRIR